MTAPPEYPPEIVLQNVQTLELKYKTAETFLEQLQEGKPVMAELFDTWHEIWNIADGYDMAEDIAKCKDQFNRMFDEIKSKEEYSALATNSLLKCFLSNQVTLMNSKKKNGRNRRFNLPTGNHVPRFDPNGLVSTDVFAAIAETHQNGPFSEAEINNARQNFFAPAEGQLRYHEKLLKETISKEKKNEKTTTHGYVLKDVSPVMQASAALDLARLAEAGHVRADPDGIALQFSSAVGARKVDICISNHFLVKYHRL